MSRKRTIEPDSVEVPKAEIDPSRRSILKGAALLGGVGAMVWPSVARSIAFDYAYRRNFTGSYPLDQADHLVLSTCLGCHASCPIRVCREREVIAKIDGNPFSPRVYRGVPPTNLEEAAKLRGALCARGQARLQNTHDPYRLLAPLVRVGPRGENAWRMVSTEEADGVLADGLEGPGLNTIKDGRNRERFVLVADTRQQDRADVLRAFGERFGTDEVHLGHPAPWLLEASSALLGEPGWLIEPNWSPSRGTLVWGADPYASGIDQVADSRALANRTGAMVVVDPRLSEVAGHADLWLPVRPGGDRALAWMLLHAWREQGVVEVDQEWFASLSDYPMGNLEMRAGLGFDVVRKAARILGDPRQVAIRVGGGVGERSGGGRVVEDILRLGILADGLSPTGGLRALRVPESVGKRPVDVLPGMLSNGPRIDILVVVGDGGIVDSPYQQELLAQLKDQERVGLLVVVSPTLNPVAALADLVVPDVTELERSGLVRRHDGTSLVQPVVHSVLEGAGLTGSWARGLDGLLERICTGIGTKLNTVEMLDRAIKSTGQEEALLARGWVPPAELPEVPTPTPYADEAVLPFWTRHVELDLVTYREAFGGWWESNAQYWVTPSLRRRNVAWLNPKTAADYHLSAGGHHGPVKPYEIHLVAGQQELWAEVRVTELIRPGVVGLAIGYGHDAGFDGKTKIDDEEVIRDPRRILGFDTGVVRTPDGLVTIEGIRDAARPSILERFSNPEGTCRRI